ncbi:DUF5689 domain-containing protein [Pseudobacter ginsenosidimutans]|uniref:DUF5689 domain-containing protein n=1 Tax=Pseudobacter ginsenosidimutans TaxID=661488 RepID=A0A4Q7N2Q5_9BACT|nr:DUF5689 domain-containing protein [Pseudobacter ginsenosidimutans]QEC43778.1 hypothetical protein FSB84_19610 [Pseudobacter ginsenosidimutans]RZS75194.1 hypothetical protein EV199_1056 [Pseudobacter ginsenosidimutans]
MRLLQYTLLIAVIAAFSSCLKEDDLRGEGQLSDVATIWTIRQAYKGNTLTLGPSTLSGAFKTRGIVISDASSRNIAPGTFVLQGIMETPNDLGNLVRGIAIDLGASTAVPYVPGDSLLIDIDGAKMERIDGRLTITGIQTSRITKLASNEPFIVRPVTLNKLNEYFEDYESTMITVHANVNEYASGVTYSGQKGLKDNTGADIVMTTRADASFAGDQVPVNAGFTGIAVYEKEKKGIAPRSGSDITDQSGVIYAGFPESFESPDFSVKGSYNMTAIDNNVDLATGNWKLFQAILGNTFLRDKFNSPGRQCVRMQQSLTVNGLIQMNFDVTEGASKVTVFCGKYYTDPSSTFKLEYSTDGGVTWIQTGAEVKDMPEKGSKLAVFNMNIPGNVRFRIAKIGTGNSTASKPNGRLCIEDIAIYKAL